VKEGIWVSECALTCLLFSFGPALIRYTQILPQVAEAYNEMFGKSLSQTVKSETGGDYEKLLLLLIESA